MQIANARREAGFTFAEVAFALLILVVGAAALINHLMVNYQTTSTERDRVFAYAKAQAMLAEIQGVVDRSQTSAGVRLEAYDDGIVSNNTLTIMTDSFGALVAPDHVVSGNYQRHGGWKWSRRITVRAFAGLGFPFSWAHSPSNNDVRYVSVRISRRDQDGNETAMADLSAVINSDGTAFPTAQVFDVYVLSIENIPGWWVSMDTIRPFVESMITDLESRSRGLEFRTHWITKASFGRNPGYRPYLNDALDSYAVIPDVYHYPGKMPAGSVSAYYYIPNNIKAHINLDGHDTNGYDATINPYPYALCDYFNHSMRYPDEKALWEARVTAVEAREAAIAAAIAVGGIQPVDLSDMSKEPTLRLFLEDLYSNPAKYRNSLVINLHGELLPMPSLRNYSDAARDPVSMPNIRVVTHPEELRTARNAATPATSDPLSFRIYAYNDHTPSYVGPPIMWRPLSVEVVGLDLTDPLSPGKLSADVTLKNVRGGVSVGGSTLYPATWETAKASDDPSLVVNEMFYYAEFINPGGTSERFTRIHLFNTPVVCPLDANGRGLANLERAQLYWKPYVPCPVESARDFSTDLTSISTILPKNTARWRMTIAPAVFTNNSFVNSSGFRYAPTNDVTVKVRTRIWSGLDPANTGTMWPVPNQPDNLSTTYAWWADSAEDVPITERSQFNGDPRHVPYKDCFNNDLDFPNSYNWFHNDLVAAASATLDYQSIDSARLRERWDGSVSCDVPRYLELFRKGLTKSSCVYTTLVGYSNYYLGIGNDIGSDASNGYPNSIPSNMVPHGTTGNGYIDTVTGSRRFVRGEGLGYWWGMPWLGELYPDSAASTWLEVDASGNMRGNLDPGTSSGQFYQGRCDTVYNGTNRKSRGVNILTNHQRMGARGCTAFFNIGSSGSTFGHIMASGNGTLVGAGLEVANNYNADMPLTAPVSRPFSLTHSVSGASEWNYNPYSNNRFSASLFKTYISHGSGVGSGVVKLVDPTNLSAAYVVVNGIDKAGAGSSFIAQWSVLTMAHSFFEAGDTSNSLRIEQLPRTEIDFPTGISELDNPSTIALQYNVDWTRWDGLPYTETGTFGENESLLEYAIMYSRDNGRTWLYVQDSSAATPGTLPTNSTYIVSDISVGSETFTWSTPSGTFPEGSYVIRVDCFRQGAQVNYSYHQVKVFFKR